MSMRTYPLIDTGLLITPAVAAHILLHADVDAGRVPDTIAPFVTKTDKGATFLPEFDPLKTDVAKLPDEYLDVFDADEVLQAAGLETVHATSFDGEAQSGAETDSFSDDRLLYVPTGKDWPDIDADLNTVVQNFRELTRDVLPAGFPIERFVRKIEGTYFC